MRNPGLKVPCLCHDGERRGDHAENEQRDQKPRRFLFQPVGTVDLEQQYHRRDHRRGDQHGIHFAYGRQHSVSLSLTSFFFTLFHFYSIRRGGLQGTFKALVIG